MDANLSRTDFSRPIFPAPSTLFPFSLRAGLAALRGGAVDWALLKPWYAHGDITDAEAAAAAAEP